MAKVLLLQFRNDPAGAARRELLSAAGAHVIEAEPRWPDFFDSVTRERPDVIVIAANRLPSHAREAARYLGEGFNTRDIPVVLVDAPRSEREKLEAYLRAYQPRAKFVERTALADALRTLV